MSVDLALLYVVESSGSRDIPMSARTEGQQDRKLVWSGCSLFEDGVGGCIAEQDRKAPPSWMTLLLVGQKYS